jgi:hypothetical protein
MIAAMHSYLDVFKAIITSVADRMRHTVRWRFLTWRQRIC